MQKHGVERLDVARALEVNPRTVDRWLDGESSVPGLVAPALGYFMLTHPERLGLPAIGAAALQASALNSVRSEAEPLSATELAPREDDFAERQERIAQMGQHVKRRDAAVTHKSRTGA